MIQKSELMGGSSLVSLSLRAEGLLTAGMFHPMILMKFSSILPILTHSVVLHHFFVLSLT